MAGVTLALSTLGAFLLLDNPWAKAWVKGHAAHSFDRRETIDREAANLIFDLERIRARFQYDPVSFLAFRPNYEERWAWKEHPEGAFTIRTNEQGFRKDSPTTLEKPGTRILVAGDSHTAGLVDNADSFCSLLEQGLRERTGEAELEVLNAGVPYTGPYCYLGALKKNLYLEPDAFVAVFFAGNDLFDDLKVRYTLDGWSPPEGDRAYVKRIQAAAERWQGPVGQGFNQLFRWKHFPWEPEKALELAAGSFLEMSALCARNGIVFLALLLPTKMDVEPEDDAATQSAVAAALALESEDLGANRALALQLGERLQAAGIAFLDLHPTLSVARHPTYWRRDYHLGLSGHAEVARVLEERLLPMLAQHSR